MKCSRDGCGRELAEFRPSLTAYHTEGKTLEESNPRPLLCEECWEEYREYWQEMWNDYYAGLM